VLYNLEDDSSEEFDMSNENFNVVNSMSVGLNNWMESVINSLMVMIIKYSKNTPYYKNLFYY